MKLTDRWFTSISEDEKGNIVFVNGRLELDEFRLSGKLKIRIEIRWSYEADEHGLPTESAGKQIEEIELLIRKAMEKDKLAIMTGNYTGGGTKYWVYYARTERVFGERLNEVLAPYETFPLEIECEVDTDWEEYLDMLHERRKFDIAIMPSLCGEGSYFLLVSFGTGSTIGLIARMVGLDFMPECFPVDMGIDLRRGNVLMAKHELNGLQISSSLEQMGGKAVTECMGADTLHYTGFLCQFLDHDENHDAGDGFAAIAQKYVLLLSKNRGRAFGIGQIPLQLGDSSLAHGYKTLFAPFAIDTQK